MRIRKIKFQLDSDYTKIEAKTKFMSDVEKLWSGWCRGVQVGHIRRKRDKDRVWYEISVHKADVGDQFVYEKGPDGKYTFNRNKEDPRNIDYPDIASARKAFKKRFIDNLKFFLGKPVDP